MSDTAPSKAVFVLLLLLVLFGAAAQAQPAFRVKDLNISRTTGIASEYGPNGLWDGFVTLGNTVFFGASDGIHGFELWRSDGTQAGTRLVADVCPGSCASIPQSLAVVNGKVFFVADDGFHGPELWRTDGTPAGTTLVRDLVPPSKPFLWIRGLTELNGKLLFSISTPDGTGDLWTSDGTAAGTVLVKNFGGNNDFSTTLMPLARLGGKVFFIANDGVHGREIWMTDGSPAGTVLLKDVNPGLAGSAPGSLDQTVAVAGGKLFFLAIGPEGFELRVSNGTPEGTSLVREIAPGPASYVIRSLTAVGREVFFLASDDGQGLELWKSDGTPAGTRPLQTIPDNARFLTAAGGRLFFASDCQLWKSDGTPEGTGVVLEIRDGPSCSPLYLLSQQGGKLLFFANDGSRGFEPWTSDGTQAGTTLLADLNPGAASSRVYRGDAFTGRWYFRAEKGENAGVQIWTTDATPAGTRMLLINRQRSGFRVSSRGNLVGPRAFFDLNGTLLFQGGNGATGAELGRSDGTDAGTVVIQDLKPGPGSSLPGEFTRAGGTVFFRNNAGTGSEKLWKTDGTAQGTQVLYAPDHLHFGGLFSPRDLTPFGQQLLFAGSYWSDFENTLLKNDGTPEGTVPVVSTPEIFNVQSLLSLKDHLVLFQADRELWRSDGTEAGTAPLATAPPLNRSRSLAEISAMRDGVLLFAATLPQTGEELWRSDGTEAGTSLAAELVPGVGWKPLGPFAAAGTAVFFAAGGIELWKNEAGITSLVRRLPHGDPAFGIRSLTALGNRVYFTYHDHARGHELWVSDGTEAGTRIVKDLLPGPGSSHPRELRVVGGTLFFSASDGVHGFEPWRSDGTRRGTSMIQDIAPGALSSSPVEFTASGPYVYFAANDGKTGFELWAIPRPPS